MPHTPGPWRIGDAGRTVFGPPNGNPSPETVAHCTSRANASLIAAAPALLKERNALRETLADLLAVAPRCPDLREQDCSYCASRIVARAALRAVEG